MTTAAVVCLLASLGPPQAMNLDAILEREGDRCGTLGFTVRRLVSERLPHELGTRGHFSYVPSSSPVGVVPPSEAILVKRLRPRTVAHPRLERLPCHRRKPSITYDFDRRNANAPKRLKRLRWDRLYSCWSRFRQVGGRCQVIFDFPVRGGTV